MIEMGCLESQNCGEPLL